ncbi:MAG TPA: Trk family potassium uptake protein [Candidatus Ventrimonas merdavium]|nr:Trk family potassium uptake protein [Candidatus Ventrimonas merdavium]
MGILRKQVVQRISRLTQTQFIAYGFIGMILLGSLLLMLPISSRDGTVTPFLNCLFTATSASCVTGLVMYDTWLHWTVFGQLVILALIQIGGLGFVTIGVFLAMVLRRRIGLKERGLMQESVNALQIGGMVTLAKKIILGTALFEGAGAVLLAIRFIPEFGVLKGIYFGIFHSVSAFCNGGFDLLGSQGAYSSLVNYYDDWLVNLVIMGLIVVGGIGFVVWDDVSRKGLHFRRYKLHTKLVLLMTLILISLPALLFYLIERDALFAGMSPSGKFLSSLFNSVTARTAGFNTTDTAGLTDASKLLTSILMMIGGSPGSTAGGIKTTTIAVLFLYVKASVQRSYGVNVFGRRLDEDAIKRASAFAVLNVSLVLAVTVYIMAVQGLPMADVLFESCSAMGTVGMTTGITRDLSPVSRFLIICLMYSGRVGGLSFALSFTEKKRIAPVRQPEEQIMIG